MPQRKKVADKPEPTVVSIREGEESMQLLADAILRVADAADELRRGPLKRRAIVLLIQDRTKLSHRRPRRAAPPARVREGGPVRRPFILKLLPLPEVVEETARNGKSYLRARVPEGEFGDRPARRWTAVTVEGDHLAADLKRREAKRLAEKAGGELVPALPEAA
jgi:hypothetical protein